MSAQQNISMTRGDSAGWGFQVVASTPSGVFLGGHQGMWFTAKRSVGDPDASAIFQKTLPSGATAGTGISISNLSTGTGALQLAPADTSALEAAIVQLSYDLQFVDSGANKYTVAAGKLTVRPDVTLS